MLHLVGNISRGIILEYFLLSCYKPRMYMGPIQYPIQLVMGSVPEYTTTGDLRWTFNPSIVEVKKEWSHTSAPLTRLHGVDRKNFTLLHQPWDFSEKFEISIKHREMEDVEVPGIFYALSRYLRVRTQSEQQSEIRLESTNVTATANCSVAPFSWHLCRVRLRNAKLSSVMNNNKTTAGVM